MFDFLKNIARAMSEGIEKEVAVSNHYHASSKAEVAANSKPQPKPVVYIPEAFNAQEEKGGEEVSNLTQDPDKVFVVHIPVKTDWDVRDNHVGIAGGQVAEDSSNGAFIKGRPVALNGVVGAGIEALPEDPEYTFYCDTPKSRNLRLIEIRSGLFKIQSEAVYEALCVALTKPENKGKAAQLVLKVALQPMESNQTESALFPFTFTKGDRKGQTATIYRLEIKAFYDFAVVLKGQPGYLNVPFSLDRCIGTSEVVAPLQTAPVEKKDIKSLSRAEAIKLAKEGKLSKDEMRQVFGVGSVNPIISSTPAPVRTLDDVKKEMDEKVKAAAEAAATDTSSDDDVEADINGDDAPISAV